VGRLLLAALFLWAGLHKILNLDGTQQYMAAYGLTLGTMLLYLGVTVQDQQFHLMKNLAIIGGLAYVLAYGAGPLSLDARRRSDR